MKLEHGLNIAHVITTIERGGAENALAILVGAQVKLGHVVTVFPLKGKLELLSLLKSSNVNVDLSLHEKSFFSQLFLSFHLMKGFSLAHAHLPRAELLTWLTSKSTPYFVTRHNAECFFPAAHKLVSKLLSRLVEHKATAIAVISETVKKFLIETGELGLSNSIYVIPYGYAPEKGPVPHHQRQDRKSLRIGTVSRLEDQKNLFFMFQVLYELKSSQLNVKLEILGSGSQKAALANFVSSLDLDNEVSFLGKSSEVVEFIRQQDLFIMTSHYEGFCLSLLEAMDANVPIVAPNHSAFPEVLGKDHYGLYKPGEINDCIRIICNLFHNYQLVDEMVSQQQERLRVFSVEKFLERHEMMYGHMGKIYG